MIDKRQDYVRAAARSLNTHSTDIEGEENRIAHFHLDFFDLRVLGRIMLFIEEDKLAFNVDDAQIGKKIDIIDVIDDSQPNPDHHPPPPRPQTPPNAAEPN